MRRFRIDQDTEGRAYFSECKRYRYTLARTWDHEKPKLLFCGLNPSCADSEHDDPTVRRMSLLARRKGYGGLIVVNLFAYIATNPRHMKAADEPIGEDNDGVIQWARHLKCQDCVAAWGAHGEFKQRGEAVLKLLRHNHYTDEPARGELLCFGATANGHPRHPLYVAGNVELTPYLGMEMRCSKQES